MSSKNTSYVVYALLLVLIVVVIYIQSRNDDAGQKPTSTPPPGPQILVKKAAEKTGGTSEEKAAEEKKKAEEKAAEEKKKAEEKASGEKKAAEEKAAEKKKAEKKATDEKKEGFIGLLIDSKHFIENEAKTNPELQIASANLVYAFLNGYEIKEDSYQEFMPKSADKASFATKALGYFAEDFMRDYYEKTGSYKCKTSMMEQLNELFPGSDVVFKNSLTWEDFNKIGSKENQQKIRAKIFECCPDLKKYF